MSEEIIPDVIATSDVPETVENIVVEEATAEEVDYTSMTLTELKAVAKAKGIKGYSTMKKADLIDAVK